LQRIAALEESIRKLPTPLSDDVEEVKRELAKLKALPPVPTQLPTDVVEAPSKLRKFGEQVLAEVAKMALREALKELWTSYGHHVIDAANAAGEWLRPFL